jgi:riboflavin biosynthesis pyrimidine reductase
MTDGPFEVDRLWPNPASGLDLTRAFLELELPDPPPDRPWVGLNMVTSLDGRAQREGTSEGIGTRADRRLMRLLRTAYDAVMYGAGTLRALDLWTTVTEGLAAEREAEGRSPQPLAVLIGGSGPIPTDRRWFATDQPRLIVVGRDGPRTVARAEVVVAPTERPEPAWILATLAERGIERVLLEGGPHLNAAFHAAGLIDELYWTVGALMLGGDGLPMVAPVPAAARPGRLMSVHRFQDELYLRYRFGPEPDPEA